jgi:hypothetical protein
MKYYVQLAAIKGNYCRSEKMNIKNADMLMNDSEKNKGIRQPNLDKHGGTCIPTFYLNTEQEQDNFINYLKTDFARFCLSIIKNNANLGAGEMNLIPYLDFTEKWDDDKLFKYFNVDKETQNYIREFLPDHHGIRK